MTSGTALLSFQLKALKVGTTMLSHDSVELFQTVGDLYPVTAQTATVTQTTTTPDGATIVVERRKDGSLSASETRADGTKGATEVTADGSEAVIKTTVLTDGGVAAALDGSATLKVVENAKSFVDTASVEGWAGDAVAFVTARALFGGVSEREFAWTGPCWSPCSTAWRTSPTAPPSSAAFPTARPSPTGPLPPCAGAWRQGILTGDGRALLPTAPVTREQLAAILMRFIDRAVGG